ncbi:MAG: hypothetical protein WKF87_12175 [Chryseolinea sp.]
MKKAILIPLVIGLIGLSGFKEDSIVFEQVAFDYFVSDILLSEFHGLSNIEFKGKTEHTYSTLGEYKFCLKPEEKLQSIIKDAAKREKAQTKRIGYDQINTISITEFKENAANPKVYVYPAIRVAENYYVFISFQMPNEPAAKYVFEINPEGRISRNCRMD